MKLDLNCDLGEGEAPQRTRALMRAVTSVNVACGGHAGDVSTMARCVRLAAEFRLRLGAHPGPTDRAGFGRHTASLSADDLELLLLQQVSALEHIARTAGVSLHHIKLHGALYHATEQSGILARRYLDVVKQYWPKVVVYALAGGRVAALARRVTVWEEAFLDRRYRADGTLVPRGQPGAVLSSVRDMLEQADRLIRRGEVITETGSCLQLKARTFCLHSDTPQAPRLAMALGRVLRTTLVKS
jgi:UPF0271 protein